MMGKSIVSKSVAKLGDDALALADEFVKAKEMAKLCEPMYQRAKRGLQALLGDHKVGVLPDGRIVTAKTTHFSEKRVEDYPDGVVRQAYDATTIDVQGDAA